jgi:head-tail adaptor
MIPARRNNCFVLIQRYTTTDGQWGETKQWIMFTQAWVSINPDRGREIFRSDERESIVTHTIRGDYFELVDVEEKMRIIDSEPGVYEPIPPTAKVFDILAVMVDEDGHEDIMIKAEQLGRRFGELTPEG